MDVSTLMTEIGQEPKCIQPGMASVSAVTGASDVGPGCRNHSLEAFSSNAVRALVVLWLAVLALMRRRARSGQQNAPGWGAEGVRSTGGIYSAIHSLEYSGSSSG